MTYTLPELREIVKYYDRRRALLALTWAADEIERLQAERTEAHMILKGNPTLDSCMVAKLVVLKNEAPIPDTGGRIGWMLSVILDGDLLSKLYFDTEADADAKLVQLAERLPNTIKQTLEQSWEVSEIERLQTEASELRELFDRQHTRTVEADKLWQQAHNQRGTYPDLGVLIAWLLERKST